LISFDHAVPAEGVGEGAAVHQRRVADQAVVFRDRAGIAERVVAERHSGGEDRRIGVARADVGQRHRLLKAKRVVGIDARPQARRAGGAAAVVVGADVEAEAITRLVGQRDDGAARILARQNLHFGLIAAQAVDLVDALLQIRELERLTHGRHRPHDTGIGQPTAALRAAGCRLIRYGRFDGLAVDLQALYLARHHGDGQHAFFEILRWQIGARGDVTALHARLGQSA